MEPSSLFLLFLAHRPRAKESQHSKGSGRLGTVTSAGLGFSCPCLIQPNALQLYEGIGHLRVLFQPSRAPHMERMIRFGLSASNSTSTFDTTPRGVQSSVGALKTISPQQLYPVILPSRTDQNHFRNIALWQVSFVASYPNAGEPIITSTTPPSPGYIHDYTAVPGYPPTSPARVSCVLDSKLGS